MTRIFPNTTALAAFLAIVITGVGLRAAFLDRPTFWVDEAESGLNALTILERGYPWFEYQGFPIYENTMLRPWPESAEFEFRDLSYSRKGYAIFHGWLPIYAMAAALKIGGVEPRLASDPMAPLHSPEDIVRLTVIPRIPAVVFSAFFMAAIFFCAHSMAGGPAAWAALVCAAFASGPIHYGRQARYFSATLLFGTLAVWFAWNAARRGRTRDWIFAGLAFVALFHTHIVYCFSALIAFAALAPWVFRQPKWYWKAAMFTAIVTAGVLPWLIVTGYLGAKSELPSSHELLRWRDVFPFSPRPITIAKLGIAALALGGAWLFLAFRRRASLLPHFKEVTPAAYFMAVWFVASYGSFLYFAPATSVAQARISLCIAVPSLLLIALGVAAFTRPVMPRYTAGAASLAMLVLLFGARRFGPKDWNEAPRNASHLEMMQAVHDARLTPTTRIYATPNEHLVLTYYTGLPIQSIAPVRKTFLDSYGGDILFLETAERFRPNLSPDTVTEVAAKIGEPISTEAAEQWSEDLLPRAVLRYYQGWSREISPPLAEPTPLEGALLAELAKRTRERVALKDSDQLIFRGMTMDSPDDWWPLYFYRFQNPDSRRDRNANYAGLLTEARTLATRSGWAIHEISRDGRPIVAGGAEIWKAEPGS